MGIIVTSRSGRSPEMTNEEILRPDVRNTELQEWLLCRKQSLIVPHNGHSWNSVLRTSGRKISSLDISGYPSLRDVTILSINFSNVNNLKTVFL